MQLEKKINSSKNLGRIFVLVVSLIVIGISGSYAYFTTNIMGTPTQSTVSSGKFEVTSSLEEANAIKDLSLRLINSEDVVAKAKSIEFSVVSTSNSTIDAKYDVYLRGITLSKNLYSSDFKWELANKDCTENCVLASGDFSNVERVGNAVDGEEANVSTTVKDMKLTNDSILLHKDTTQNIIFRIWLQNDDSRNQIELTNGRFEGKLSISAVPAEMN